MSFAPSCRQPRRPTQVLLALAFALAMLLGPLAAFAGELPASVSRVIERVAAEGFNHIVVRRSWLGRVILEAEGPGLAREIVINPNTGEILRDWTARRQEDGPTPGSGGSFGGGDGAASGDAAVSQDGGGEGPGEDDDQGHDDHDAGDDEGDGDDG